MSIIRDDFIRHNSTIIADTLIKMICDDLKFQDKQNEPEYVMLNSKLQVDKEIERDIKRNSKNKKEKNNAKNKKTQSKFVSKYSDRIESIKSSDKKADRRKKARQAKKVKTMEMNEDNEFANIQEIIKQKEDILRKLIDNQQQSSQTIRPKDYDTIRKEKIEKFNNRR